MKPRLHRLADIGAVLCILLFAVNAMMFLPHQSLWVDETTQLRGLTLGFRGLQNWLTGGGPDLGVPPDMSPPGSYFLQELWIRVAGLTEGGLRWFGLLCALVGVGFTVAAARRVFGSLGAFAAALYMGLSSNLVIYGVEIRAYPVYFMVAGIGCYCLTRCLEATERERGSRIALLCLALVFAGYTHYFGVLFAGACFLALMFDAIRRGLPLKPVVIACCTVFAAFAGLVQYVIAAMRVGSAGPSLAASERLSRSLHGAVQMLYRLYGHPTLAASMVATAFATAGVALIVLGVVWSRRSLGPVVAGLALALASGLTVAFVASFVARSFPATASQYNLWALPLVAMILAFCTTLRGSWPRRFAVTGLAALYVGTGIGMIQLHRFPDAYAHGPARQILASIDELGPSRVAVIYDAESDAVGNLLFPIRYTYGPVVKQYDASGCMLRDLDGEEGVAASVTSDYAIVIRARRTTGGEIARRLAGEDGAWKPMAAAEAFKRDRWTSVRQARYLALASADVETLERKR